MSQCEFQRVRLIPHCVVGRVVLKVSRHDEEHVSVALTWTAEDDSSRETLTLTHGSTLFVDRLSSTLLLSVDVSDVSDVASVRMMHFLNDDPATVISHLQRILSDSASAASSDEHVSVDSNAPSAPSAPYVSYVSFTLPLVVSSPSQTEQSNDMAASASHNVPFDSTHGSDPLDDTAIDVLSAFARIKRVYVETAKGLFRSLKLSGRSDVLSHRPKTATGRIPVNPWIVDRPLQLPKSTIVSPELQPAALSLPMQMSEEAQCRLVYNSGGAILTASTRRIFWTQMLSRSDPSNYAHSDPPSYTDCLAARTDEQAARIDKDLHRLGEDDEAVLATLRGILEAYCCGWDCETGYVQGMADLALPVVRVIGDETTSFTCFAGLMRHVRCNFLSTDTPDSIQHQLHTLRLLIKTLNPLLHDYLTFNRDSNSLFFCYRWLLVLFRREFSPEDANRVWDVAFAASRLAILPLRHFRLFFALAMIFAERDTFMQQCRRFEDLLIYFNEKAGKWDVSALLQLTDQLINYCRIHEPELFSQVTQHATDEPRRSGPLTGE